MQLSGIEGEQVVLILEDHQVDASFLELINSLLSAGEVPGLYTPEELEPLLGPLRDQASQDGFRGTLVSYFASRVKRNLHIVLIMDSSSRDFTANCESNPAFYKNCAFEWMEGWSRESMGQSKRTKFCVVFASAFWSVFQIRGGLRSKTLQARKWFGGNSGQLTHCNTLLAPCLKRI